MLNFLLPDFYFHSIHELDTSFFKENNFKGILFDIDNTLEPYATQLPGLKTKALFERLKDADIKISVISNNHKERVEAFCKPLGVGYSYDSAKPSSKKILQAIDEMGLDLSEVVIVGDQLFTDIWAGNNTKIKSIFVDRIDKKESFFIKLKRVLEIPFVRIIKNKGEGKIK